MVPPLGVFASKEDSSKLSNNGSGNSSGEKLKPVCRIEKSEHRYSDGAVETRTTLKCVRIITESGGRIKQQPGEGSKLNKSDDQIVKEFMSSRK